MTVTPVTLMLDSLRLVLVLVFVRPTLPPTLMLLIVSTLIATRHVQTVQDLPNTSVLAVSPLQGWLERPLTHVAVILGSFLTSTPPPARYAIILV